MTIDNAVDSKISNRTINTNRISNRTYDSKSNRITKLRRSLAIMETGVLQVQVRSYGTAFQLICNKLTFFIWTWKPSTMPRP